MIPKTKSLLKYLTKIIEVILVILDLNEVKDQYKIFKGPRAQDSTETTE